MKRVLLWVILFLLLISSAFAFSGELYSVFFFNDEFGLVLEEVYVVPDTEDYLSFLLEDMESSDNLTLSFFDNNNTELYSVPMSKTKTFFRFDRLPQDSVKMRVFKDTNPQFEHDLSFCNHNGVCEGCFDLMCENAETYLVCEDCKSGTDDGFCDLAKDGVCDPNCKYGDEDCFVEEKFVQNVDPLDIEYDLGIDPVYLRDSEPEVDWKIFLMTFVVCIFIAVLIYEYVHLDTHELVIVTQRAEYLRKYKYTDSQIKDYLRKEGFKNRYIDGALSRLNK
ncbi:hypothetical protein HN419_02035 [Candidatus Woesearchaeota archaeon]|jgi:hypothetical protein|nr:hypothetical protein [Candidatus Woesearchaeota archaeon]MBT3537223.1 hypothetical protein [Candidatus Woesearchaeota archaeon]MBT4698210.1 hypothetical protein [Candidatus Woesearchaeota archaeon]MBT4717745.1 hypothetical protein [Candidatus Woesearchaeota archaeon]MBT7106467.1 hypothetical protein [Candidatus Woesearchaeota archaeon]